MPSGPTSRECTLKTNGMLDIRPAAPADRDAIDAILAACGLSRDIRLDDRCLGWLAHKDGLPCGYAGLELGGDAALVRSVAVLPTFRGLGIAHLLLRRITAEARSRRILSLYLFSKDTGGFFTSHGWQSVPVSQVAETLPDAPQVRHYQTAGWYPDEKAFHILIEPGA